MDGRKTCQANNAYEIHQPKDGSLGDKLLKSSVPSSESKVETAKGLDSEISVVPTPKPANHPPLTPEARPAHRELPTWFTKFRASMSP
jgi:hypothetical protein